MAEPGPLLMIIDPDTKEAYRVGDDPRTSGPVFFTTRDHLDAYAQEHALAPYEVYEVPGGVLDRMKGKPHWVDGDRR
jgi:hypothetical protein